VTGKRKEENCNAATMVTHNDTNVNEAAGDIKSRKKDQRPKPIH